MVTAARGGGLGLLGMVCSRIISLLLQAAIARLFGITFFGYYITGVMICRFLQVVAGLGLNIGSIRFMVQSMAHGNRHTMFLVYWASIFTPVCAGTILGIFFYLTTPYLCNHVFSEPGLLPVLQLFSFAIPWFALLRVLAELSRSFGTVRYTVIVEDFLFPLLQICTLMFAYICNTSALIAVISFVASTISCAAIMGLVVYQQIKRHIFCQLNDSKNNIPFRIRELFNYSMPLMPTGLFFMVSNNIDILMLNIFNSSGAVGIYAAATRWTILVDSIGAPITAIFRPLIARSISLEDTQMLRSLFMASCRWVLYLTLPFIAFLIFASEPAMGFFLQEDAQGIASSLLWILLLARITNPLGNGAGLVLSMGGHQYRELIALACGAFLNALLNALLIPRYGVIGAALSTGTGFYLTTLLRISFVRKRWNMVPWCKHMCIPGIALGIVMIIRLSFGFDIPPALQIAGGGVAALFVIISFLFFSLEQDDKIIVQLLPQSIQIKIDILISKINLFTSKINQ